MCDAHISRVQVCKGGFYDVSKDTFDAAALKINDAGINVVVNLVWGLRRVERLIQRNLTSSEIVMVSDADEVPSRTFVCGLRLCNVALPTKMNMMFFYYSLRHVHL